MRFASQITTTTTTTCSSGICSSIAACGAGEVSWYPSIGMCRCMEYFCWYYGYVFVVERRVERLVCKAFTTCARRCMALTATVHQCVRQYLRYQHDKSFNHRIFVYYSLRTRCSHQIHAATTTDAAPPLLNSVHVDGSRIVPAILAHAQLLYSSSLIRRMLPTNTSTTRLTVPILLPILFILIIPNRQTHA